MNGIIGRTMIVRPINGSLNTLTKIVVKKIYIFRVKSFT